MRTPKPADALFWLLAAVAAVVFVLFALVLGGAIPIGTEDPAGGAAGQRAAPVVAEPEPEPAVDEPAVAAPRSSTSSATRRRAPRLVTVVVTATRGDCWLSARANTEDGRVLDERVLVQGESVRLRAARVWLSLGAASNVDVVVDEQPREVPAGTVELVLAPRSST